LCAIVREAVKNNRSKGLPYLYNEKKHIGENCIAEITKEFACEMGFDNWHRITNHSNRKLGVTTVATNAEKGVLPVLMKSTRHKHLNTQLNYQLENEDMLKSYQRRSGKCEKSTIQCGSNRGCQCEGTLQC
jgi:hypothetical protein